MKASLLTISIFFYVLSYFSQSITTNGVVLVETTAGNPSVCWAGGFDLLYPAAQSGSCIEMTTGGGNFESSAVWACDPIDLNQTFKVSFTANFGSDNGAGDGLAFVLQTEGVPQVKGGQGGGIGYSYGNEAGCQGGTCPISPSLAIEFDTYDHSSDPLTPPINDAACDHLSIQKNGLMDAFNSILNPVCLNASGSVIDGSDHNVCISWDPALPALEIYFDGVSVAVSNVNIAAPFAYFFNPSSVYWGFTSAKGPAPQQQSVCNVIMETNISPCNCAVALSDDRLSLEAEPIYGLESTQVELTLNHNGENKNLIQIERSADGNTFTPISDIHTWGELSIDGFSFIDFSPFKGENYYRLKMMDSRNDIRYSNISFVRIESFADDLFIYPNPVLEKAIVSFSSKDKSETALTVYNLFGEIVMYNQFDSEKGLNKIELSTIDFSAGVYILQLHNGRESKYLRLIKD